VTAPAPAAAPLTGLARLVDAVRRANAPPPPENSVALRVTTAAAVFVGVAACASVSEVPLYGAALAVLAIGAGMAFSFATRHRPWRGIKLVLAIAVLAVFADFVVSVSSAARAGDIASVEAPLAGLFIWVQVIHAFDVPARRDLLFSLAASGVLLAVAGAQALSSSFAGYAGIWLVTVVIGLVLSWQSILGGRGPAPARSVVGSLLAIAFGGALMIALLPAPQAGRTLTLPASISSLVSIADPGSFAGGSTGAQPVQPGSPGGASGVGGFVGFAGPLDTALRGTFSDEVLFHVRATLPGYFLGVTYDSWDGESWTSSTPFRHTTELSTGSPFGVPPTGGGGEASGPTDVQTFYVAVPLPNLIFSTGQPEQVWFPGRDLFVGKDGSLRTGVAITPGTVYTVVSDDDQATSAELASDNTTISPVSPISPLAPYVQLPQPNPYANVKALTLSITRHAPTLYGKVEALEAWMATHVQYSLDIPPLPRGADAVESFLFGTRIGFCEQISTALAVMLRTIGVPAREAVGYVPGAYNPLTNLYEVEANDAHAWVQVYFPGLGWQSFDPTADVPLAPPDPGAVLFGDAWHALLRLPWVEILPVIGVVAIEETVRRRWRRRPRTWAGRLLRDLETCGARSGTVRRVTETLPEYAHRLEAAGMADLHREPVRTAVAVLERATFAPAEPHRAECEAAESAVRTYARAQRRRRQPEPRSSAAANEAPSASSER
jgi:transglutaminase-like putative cysteine protease